MASEPQPRALSDVEPSELPPETESAPAPAAPPADDEGGKKRKKKS